MRKIMLLTAAFIFIFTNTAYADDQPLLIVKDYEFVTTDTHFDYDAPMEITEGDIIYQRNSIDYEVIREEPVYTTETKIFTEEITEEGLHEKDDAIFEDSIEINDDGYKGLLCIGYRTF